MQQNSSSQGPRERLGQTVRGRISGKVGPSSVVTRGLSHRYKDGGPGPEMTRITSITKRGLYR